MSQDRVTRRWRRPRELRWEYKMPVRPRGGGDRFDRRGTVYGGDGGNLSALDSRTGKDVGTSKWDTRVCFAMNLRKTGVST